MSEWDAFTSELSRAGAERYLELVNTAYRRYRDANG